MFPQFNNWPRPSIASDTLPMKRKFLHSGNEVVGGKSASLNDLSFVTRASPAAVANPQYNELYDTDREHAESTELERRIVQYDLHSFEVNPVQFTRHPNESINSQFFDDADSGIGFQMAPHYVYEDDRQSNAKFKSAYDIRRESMKLQSMDATAVTGYDASAQEKKKKKHNFIKKLNFKKNKGKT